MRRVLLVVICGLFLFYEDCLGACKYLEVHDIDADGNPIDWTQLILANKHANYWINNDGGPFHLPPGSGEAAIRQAADVWDSNTCLTFAYMGETDEATWTPNGIWTVGWQSVWTEVRGERAVTKWQANGVAGQQVAVLEKLDTFMNNEEYYWTDGSCVEPPGADDCSIQVVMVHEFGHWVGLADNDGAGGTVMDRNHGPCDMTYVTLTTSDIDCTKSLHVCALGDPGGCFGQVETWGGLRHCLMGGSGVSGVQAPLNAYALLRPDGIREVKYVPDTPFGTVWGPHIICGNFEQSSENFRFYRSEDGGNEYSLIGTLNNMSQVHRLDIQDDVDADQQYIYRVLSDRFYTEYARLPAMGVGEITLAHTPLDIATYTGTSGSQRWIYVTQKGGFIDLIDASNPAAPVRRYSLNLGTLGYWNSPLDDPVSIEVENNGPADIALVALGNNGVLRFRIDNQTASPPALFYHMPELAPAYHIELDQSPYSPQYYVSSGTNGLRKVSRTSDVQLAVYRPMLNTQTYASVQHSFIYKNHLYVTLDPCVATRVVRKTTLIEEGSLPDYESGYARWVANDAEEDILYVTSGNSDTCLPRWAALDISDPMNPSYHIIPRALALFYDRGRLPHRAITKRGKYAYVAGDIRVYDQDLGWRHWGGAQIFDTELWTDPDGPSKFVGAIADSGYISRETYADPHLTIVALDDFGDSETESRNYVVVGYRESDVGNQRYNRIKIYQDDAYLPTNILGIGDYAELAPGPVNGLMQNFPNPFNPRTTIRFDVAGKGDVSLKIYDASGRLVRELVRGIFEPGTYEAIWNGLSDNHQSVASGVYFYRLEAGEFAQMKKMVVIK